MLGNIGLTEIIIILVILILIFGNKKIKDLAQNAGKAGKELKRVENEYHEALNEVKKDVSISIDEVVKPEKVKKDPPSRKASEGKGGEKNG